MKTVNITELAQRVEQLEQAQASLLEALKLLLPLAIAVPACSADSAAALKALRSAMDDAETFQPRSGDCWDLASAMLLMLSGRAVRQHPNDPAVLAIHHGLRPGKKH